MDSHSQLRDVYRRMRTIRALEQKLEALIVAGKLTGFLHLSIGQEAVAVGVCNQLRDTDLVASTHRPHGHWVAKGLAVETLLAELYGRATGCCNGKGGSFHISDLSRGMIGANGVVGAGLPLAAGAALSAKLRKTGAVVVGFMGDGATNQGMFHEALNLAAIWKLPVVYVIENNGWSEFTPADYVTPIKDLALRAAGYAMPSAIADGMDYFDVATKTAEAVARARAGGGPTLIECKTYRFAGHMVGDPLAYRSKAEAERWAESADPLVRFEQRVGETGLGAAELRAIDVEVDAALAQAFAAAEAAPLPDLSEATAHVYAGAAASAGGAS